MKVVVSPDGQVSFETDDVEQALAMVNSLRAGAKAAPKKHAHHHHKKKADGGTSLSPALAQTWEWLVAHDSTEGVTTAEVAEGLGLQEPAATWRLNRLLKKELAHRLKRGHYRAGLRTEETP